MSTTATPAGRPDGEREIVVGEGGYTLPIAEIAMGRGFITGKSGSGKSNSATVVLEELFSAGIPALIVDIDGEYHPLADEYDVLHVGQSEECDRIIDESDAADLASAALDRRVSIILDVSGIIDEESTHSLIEAVCSELFHQQMQHRTPYLLVVEEIHEFVPEHGNEDLNQLLVRIAKRGRKRGLGLLGISQRPADVRKAYITQCDWLVWHRLTWPNDIDTAADLVGREYANDVDELDDGEAYVVTDRDDQVQAVQFRQKRVFDAGATPSLDLSNGLGAVDDALDVLGDDPEDPPAPPADLSECTPIGVDIGVKQLICAGANTGSPEIEDCLSISGGPENTMLHELHELAETVAGESREELITTYDEILATRIDLAVDRFFRFVDEFDRPVIALEKISYASSIPIDQFVEDYDACNASVWLMPKVREQIVSEAAQRDVPVADVHRFNSTEECHYCGRTETRVTGRTVICESDDCPADEVDRDKSAAVTLAGRLDGAIAQEDLIVEKHVECGQTVDWICSNAVDGLSHREVRDLLRDLGHLKEWQDPLWLREKYCDEGLSTAEIAQDRLDGEVSGETVRRWVHTFGLIDDESGASNSEAAPTADASGGETPTALTDGGDRR